MNRRAFALGVIAAVIAACLTHVASLTAPFFADDWLFLDQVRFHSLGHVLASPDPLGNFFRPLGRQVWFWLLAHLGGESPVVFHAANLACFVAAVVLLALVAKRVAGPFAGVVAAAFLAVHYAADVPVLWVSGSQELLSLALALGALLASVTRRRALAAVLLFLALLAKEAVVLAPIAAIALDDDPRWSARIRRAWPLGLAVLAWVALAAWAMARRGAPGAGLALTPIGPLIAPLLLVRVVLGLEWLTGALPLTHFTDPGGASLLAIALAAAGVWMAAAPREKKEVRGKPAAKSQARKLRTAPAVARAPMPAVSTGPLPVSGTRNPAHAARAGAIWALAGALPVAVVAPVWSAYYFLFAVAGAGLALGALAARARLSGFTAAVLLVAAGFASSQARGLQEFATAPAAWTGQSHVNRFYLQRGMRVISRCIADLEQQLPHAEPRTTFFFAGLPPFASFQVADGPLVRGVYRDSSLRGYYLSQLSAERLTRGPRRVFFFDQTSGRLIDRTREPGVFMSSALGQIMNNHLDVAEAALQAAAANGEDQFGRAYIAAFVALDRGDRPRALGLFAESGHGTGSDGSQDLRAARARLAALDTAGALKILREGISRSVLDPALHAQVADLLIMRPSTVADGEAEAYAARVLAPESAPAWRRWAFLLAIENRQDESIAAIDRYFALMPIAAARDLQAIRLRAVETRMLPGGDLAQRSMKKELAR